MVEITSVTSHYEARQLISLSWTVDIIISRSSWFLLPKEQYFIHKIVNPVMSASVIVNSQSGFGSRAREWQQDLHNSKFHVFSKGAVELKSCGLRFYVFSRRY